MTPAGSEFVVDDILDALQFSILLDRSRKPPRHAVLIEDCGISMSVRLVFGFAFGRRSRLKGSCVRGVDVLHPQVQRRRARFPRSARLTEHDQRVANSNLGVHHGVVGVSLATGFGAPEGFPQESEFGIRIRNHEVGCNGAIRVS